MGRTIGLLRAERVVMQWQRLASVAKLYGATAAVGVALAVSGVLFPVPAWQQFTFGFGGILGGGMALITGGVGVTLAYRRADYRHARRVIRAHQMVDLHSRRSRR